ncbi:MAG: iron ABC transporter permease [Candidatus Diapherotrites archaeon]|uniref:Iron ABC transporter permease n=1 Tax=Candidatus Iainarchaeum sp. TaxID=3101447 RepID=A0A8T4KYG3_9ARCH|nr:iron ABC transporter permease [Candidatus Diapherotrites archaeon]
MGKNNVLLKIFFFLPLLFFALFFFYPLLLVFLNAFTSDFTAFPLFFSTILFSNSRLVVNSLIQAAASTVLAFLIGFPAAYLIAKYDFPGKNFFKAMTFIPFVVPSILVALSFVIIFGLNGWLNRFLMSLLGLSEPPITILYSFYGIMLAHAFYNFPIFVRFVSNAWGNTEARLEEAARTLGANRIQTFFRVTIFQLAPAILAAAAIVFIYSFMSFAIVLTLGGVSFTTLEVGVFYSITRNLDLQTGAALALIQFAFLFLVLFLYSFFSRKFSLTHTTFTEKARKLGFFSFQGFFSGLYLLFIALIVLLPILALLFFALTVPSTGEFSLSPQPFLDVFFSGKKNLVGVTPLTAVLNSLFFALIASLLSTFFGLIFAFRQRHSSNLFISALMMSSIAISSITLGLGYLLGFGIGAWFWIPIAHSVIAFPFAFKSISNALNRIDYSLTSAAETLGADAKNVFLRIELPLIRGAVFSALTFSFAISLGELGLSFLLFEGTWVTMPIYIYRFISSYNLFGAAAMGLVLITISTLCFYLIEKFNKEFSVV